VYPYSTATVIKCKTPPVLIDPITQLINQMTSTNLEISKVALTKLDKMLIEPEVSITSNILIYLVLIYCRYIKYLFVADKIKAFRRWKSVVTFSWNY